jgi:PPM family protein phosphatase
VGGGADLYASGALIRGTAGREADGVAGTGLSMHDLELAYGYATHPGTRAENQDRCLTAPPVFAIADGMGGHAAGGAASQAVVRRLAACASGPSADVEELRGALGGAEKDIARIGQFEGGSSGAGTTVAGLALVEDGGVPRWAVFHVGDSRIYRWTGSGLEQVSTDHSVVQELLDAGHITEEQARTHPQRHMITRALGFGDRGEAEFALLPVAGGERFLLCSDGLSGVVPEARIAELMAAAEDFQALADELVREAVEAGGQDNISVVVVRVGSYHGG